MGVPESTPSGERVSPDQQAAIVKAAVEWVDAQAATMKDGEKVFEKVLDRMDAACEGLIRAVEDSR